MIYKKIKKKVDYLKLKLNESGLFFKKYYKYLSKRLSKKLFPEIEVANFIVKLAETNLEIKNAQSLRYAVFYKEKNAKATLSKKTLRRDFDKFDFYADHLIIIDKNRKIFHNKVIGTYRLVRGDIANKYGGFYTSSEFDLSNIFELYKNNEILELGRSCIHKKYRNGIAMKLLWKAIANYVTLHEIKILLGCVSFPGTNVMDFSDELSYLKKHHSLQNNIAVESLHNNIYPKLNFKTKNASDKKTFVKLPPLIKGYLRVGGKVSKSYFIDYNFNTTDLCVVVQTNNINDKYKKRFYTNQITHE